MNGTVTGTDRFLAKTKTDQAWMRRPFTLITFGLKRPLKLVEVFQQKAV